MISSSPLPLSGIYKIITGKWISRGLTSPPEHCLFDIFARLTGIPSLMCQTKKFWFAIWNYLPSSVFYFGWCYYQLLSCSSPKPFLILLFLLPFTSDPSPASYITHPSTFVHLQCSYPKLASFLDFLFYPT